MGVIAASEISCSRKRVWLRESMEAGRDSRVESNEGSRRRLISEVWKMLKLGGYVDGEESESTVGGKDGNGAA